MCLALLKHNNYQNTVNYTATRWLKVGLSKNVGHKHDLHHKIFCSNSYDYLMWFLGMSFYDFFFNQKINTTNSTTATNNKQFILKQ